MVFVVTVLFLLIGLPLSAQISGCTDSKAQNFVSNATINDGSCKYKETVFNPIKIADLSSEISESSGIIFYNGNIWTHNDSGGEAILYEVDPKTGNVLKQVVIANATFFDWEDITMDDQYVYIGDFGNNDGSRKDLSIAKFLLAELDQDTAYATVMNFNYEDQTDFSIQNQNNNYDAEAIMTMGDSLYIFSKNWRNLKTRIYSLPKTFQYYTASVVDSLSPNGLITGADYFIKDGVVVLCGYNLLLQPFIYLLWDFKNKKFSEGNQRKINFNLPFNQIEGVAINSLQQLYLTNESISNKLINIKAALFEMDISQWFNIVEDGVQNSVESNSIKLFPNPTKDELNIEWDAKWNIYRIEIFDMSGKNSEVWNLDSIDPTFQINISNLKKGVYILKLSGKNTTQYKKFVKQ